MYRLPSEADETEELKATVELYERTGSISQASRSAGVSKDTIRTRIHKAAERGLMGTKPVLPGFRIKEASRQINADGDVEREWIKQAKEHGEPFSLPDGHIIKGISALTDEDGKLIQQWVKTKTDTVTPDLVAALKETFKEYAGKAEVIPGPDHSDESLLSLYPIADQHIGLLAWGKETGEDDYDLKIGVERLRSCATRLISQSPASKYAIILNLGDWNHNDDQTNMTPGHGNILDVDTRYFKILQAGVQLMMDIIELALQRHETILVRNIPGNHDPHASIALTVALGAFYSSNPRVVVDDDPGDFFFHRFGETLIGATHGHKCKPDKMAMAMAVRCREDWGATKYHWMLHGHFHRQAAEEIGDVRVEGFQTLAANDAYSASHGYNSGKSLNSITLHFDEGEIGRHRVNFAPAWKK
jgi:transposase/predicted phosphodiesterase